MGNFSNVLIQVSKILAILINNKNLNNIDEKIKIINSKIKIDFLFDYLKNLFSKYPNWSNDIPDEVVKYILDIILLYNFKFIINLEGNDALYFD